MKISLPAAQRPRKLIRQGVQVTVFNQRSVADILAMMEQVAAMVGESAQARQKIAAICYQLQGIETAAKALPRRPRVYFEEWDTPPISAIRWVSELVGIAGGDDCFPELAQQPLGKDRAQGGGKQEGLDPHVAQPGDRARGPTTCTRIRRRGH